LLESLRLLGLNTDLSQILIPFKIKTSEGLFPSISKWIGFFVLVLLTLTACQTYQYKDIWPAEMPARELFIQGYLEKRGIETATQEELVYHLGWIKKFYMGTLLSPNGWLSASERYIASIKSSKEKADVDVRLKKLGVKIANEWAQDKKDRLINSANIAKWAEAMHTAAERHEHTAFLSMIEKDVQLLLDKEITARDIQYERYYSEEPFGTF